MLTSALAGLAFGLSLIVAIGAQNTFVLRQGLLRQRVLTVVTICATSDVLLIVAGVAGAGVVLTDRPSLLQIVRVVGALFLFGYAAMAARRVWRPTALTVDPRGQLVPLLTIVTTSLALTWLNPGVYLDTLILLGSVANTRGGHQWWFGAGAAVASVLWFAGLGYGARLLTPLFRHRQAWRVLDSAVVVIMLVTGLRVLLSA